MVQNKKNTYRVNPKAVDWESKNSCLFFNERHSEKALFKASIPHLPYLKAHIWLATSGRTQQKWVALSKKAFLLSAQAVNQHLSASSKDQWGLCLPLFHVGGLSITARAFLSQIPYFVYTGKWSAQAFYDFLKQKKITLCSLVPTQVYDLVRAKLLAPSSLRAIVVGGESLSPSLYKSARTLKWPVLPSYGLTECGSQVATAELSSLKTLTFPSLKILSHVELKIKKGEIALKSKSLLTGFWPLSTGQTMLPSIGEEAYEGFSPSKQALKPAIKGKKSPLGHFVSFLSNTNSQNTGGWYLTGDKGRTFKIKANKGLFLKVDKAESIKILGEKVNMSHLEDKFTHLLLKHAVLGRAFLLPLPAEREGWQIAVVTNYFDKKALFSTVFEFNQKVSPFEKIKLIYFVPTLPLTSISKLNRKALLKKLGIEV